VFWHPSTPAAIPSVAGGPPDPDALGPPAHPAPATILEFLETSTVLLVTGAYARRLLGWRLGATMTTQLLLDALEQAIWTRQRSDQSVEHVVAHSDRGSQYTSIRYSERLAEVGIAASVGSVGDSNDNALADAVNSLYKAEVIRHRGPWRSLDRRRIHHRRMDRLLQPPAPARVLRRHPTSRTRGRVLRSPTSPATRRARRLRQSPDTPAGFTARRRHAPGQQVTEPG
jgi:transposase InsO family protein